MSSEYIIPRHYYIGRHEETERLYQLEGTRSIAIRDVADEYAKVRGDGWSSHTQWDSREGGNYYQKTLPQVLFDTLNSYNKQSAKAACVGWLFANGFMQLDVLAEVKAQLEREYAG